MSGKCCEYCTCCGKPKKHGKSTEQFFLYKKSTDDTNTPKKGKNFGESFLRRRDYNRAQDYLDKTNVPELLDSSSSSDNDDSEYEEKMKRAAGAMTKKKPTGVRDVVKEVMLREHEDEAKKLRREIQSSSVPGARRARPSTAPSQRSKSEQWW